MLPFVLYTSPAVLKGSDGAVGVWSPLVHLHAHTTNTRMYTCKQQLSFVLRGGGKNSLLAGLKFLEDAKKAHRPEEREMLQHITWVHDHDSGDYYCLLCRLCTHSPPLVWIIITFFFFANSKQSNFSPKPQTEERQTFKGRQTTNRMYSFVSTERRSCRRAPWRDVMEFMIFAKATLECP